MSLKEELEETMGHLDIVNIHVKKDSDYQGKRATDIIVSFMAAGKKWEAVWTYAKELAMSNTEIAENMAKTIAEEIKQIKKTGGPR